VARSRRRFRRQKVLLVIAAVLTVLVLAFARGVDRSAHRASGVRTTEDLSFAALANNLVAQENAVDANLAGLASTGASDNRATLAAALASNAAHVATWNDLAALSARPTLTSRLNATLVAQTRARVNDDIALVASLARTLQLPLGVASSESVTAATSSLTATSRAWNAAALTFATSPGRPQLTALTNFAGLVNWATAETALSAAPSLTLRPGVGVAAVSITPAPLPSPVGTLNLIPTYALRVAVSVVNDAYDNQPVTVTMSLSSAARTLSRRVALVLPPLGARAWVPHWLGVHPGEQATLVVAVQGAPAAPSRVLVRRYQVVVATNG
jgi:hypothetical protein